MTDSVHERDLVATDEMIRNLRAGTFQKLAMGLGVGCGVLFLGAAILVSAWKTGNDPEVLKETLRHMPPLNVTVTLDPNSRTVKLEQPAMVTLANPPTFPQASLGGGSHDPAIATSVTVFKTVEYGAGIIETGWNFANGAARTPEYQFCHYKQSVGDGGTALQTIGRNGVQAPSPANVKDQAERFAKCQWFNGNLG